MLETMNNRQRAMNILHYREADRMPLVHFGFWHETLEKWHREGHLTREEWQGWTDGNSLDDSITRKLGFDFNWANCYSPRISIWPEFQRQTICEQSDGSRHVRDALGVTLLERPGAGSIPAEIDHLLTDRGSWEEHYRWRLEWVTERVEKSPVRIGDDNVPFDEGGLEFLRSEDHETPRGLFCGSLYGRIRDIVGVQNLSLMTMLDPDLFEEILDTSARLSLHCVEYVLEKGARFDFAHFWEDICFKNGPLVQPELFREKVGPWYQRITRVLNDHGIDIVSLDCDGMIDTLIPIWLENGVNTMFPIEVGTWNASILPWRERHGRELRGVGGMNKVVFARDRQAIDDEIQRLRPLVELGGYIPCPDHRIAPDAKWELVQYYCDKMREL